ncbi:hypothetical protein ABC977_01405 [Thioalkalicoccus limnaeus]|uniref:Uncharacterized protein n=1 Tax=Thioalkalicoccus limnaeus TaxID=120681 RepID=A0ABV4B9L0_9GAMM
MAEWFESGRIIDLILFLVVVEAVAILAYRRISGRGPALADLLSNLLAGACLMLAVRAALVDAGWQWVAVWLFAGLVAHLFDLSRRWRR